jgi:antitoxin PrlF
MPLTSPVRSKISSKGQVTVPIEIRHRLGLKPGDHIEFAVEGSLTVVRPARPEENPFAKWVGVAPYFKSREEIIDYHRDIRGHDEPNG